MNKNEELKRRVNFSYYEENLTQKEIALLLNISRQKVSAILNANDNHKLRKARLYSTSKIVSLVYVKWYK